jgi:hypothetical protein
VTPIQPGSGQPEERPARVPTAWPMRARMAAYSALNSAPSRLSHSSSDGVNGRGAEEITGLGFDEDVDAEADVFSPVFVESSPCLSREGRAKGGRGARTPAGGWFTREGFRSTLVTR